jgi:hypothetical protein
MSTVVQRTYRPQQAPGVAGMIVDETRASVITRQCATAAGIGYGLAVSQGTKDTDAVIGGAAFIGLTVRDVTVDQIPLDPLYSGGPIPVDTYPQYKDMGVMTTGHMWVQCLGGGATGVKGGDALFANAAGQLSNSASGTSATGSIVFSKIPANNETITINAVAITFHTSGATGDDMNINYPTLGDFVAALANKLNGSATAGLTPLQFRADPPSPGGSGQGSGANTLLIGAETVGTAANAYTLATTCAGSTVSGATLAGGAATATAIVGGYWLTSAIAGQLAVVSLGIGR